MTLAADMPFNFANVFHGAGVQLLNDKLGVFRHQKMGAQYAYKPQLLGGTLSLGVQVSLLMESLDGTQLDAGQGNDPALPTTQVTGNGVDFAIGAYYMRGNLYVGLSAQHLTSPVITLGDKYELPISPTYYLTGGYNIKLRNPFVTIKPSALLRTDGSSYRADVTTRVVYTHEKRVLYAGLGYSPTISVTGMIGGTFHGIIIGYSYEMYTSAIKPGNGSHELFVGYQTDVNLVKKGKNKHKSVRIL